MRSLITIPKDLFQQFRSPASSNSLVAGPVASKEAKLISKVGTAVDQTGRCGCISQFQVNVDTMGTILSTTAATKKIVLGSDRLPFKTTNGKLMLSECSCQVNNKISSILAERFTGMPLEYAANEVFSPAATPEFLRTLLRNLGLPAKHAHCLRLVEAAAAEARRPALAPLRRWVDNHLEQLNAIESPLNMELTCLEYLDILEFSEPNHKAPVKAFEFAQEHFPKFCGRHLPEVRRLMGLLAWGAGAPPEDGGREPGGCGQRLRDAPAADLLGPGPRRRAAATLLRDGARINGLPPESHLATCALAGAAALPTLGRMARAVRDTGHRGRRWADLAELPAELPLAKGRGLHHSVFSCPVSRALSTPGHGPEGRGADPPVALACGHAVLRSSLSSLAGSDGRFKCPTCPEQQTINQVTELYI